MLTPEDRIGPRPTKQGAVDLTGGKLFLSDPVQHTNLVNIVEKYGTEKLVVWDGGRMVKYHAIIRMLLSFNPRHSSILEPKTNFVESPIDLIH